MPKEQPPVETLEIVKAYGTRHIVNTIHHLRGFPNHVNAAKAALYNAALVEKGEKPLDLTDALYAHLDKDVKPATLKAIADFNSKSATPAPVKKTEAKKP